jgi:ornithine carbamoyltransferase
MKNLLSIESLSAGEIVRILDLADEMKVMRGRHAEHPLRHQCWALMFSKSSTRTRVSFEVGIRELGGDVIFLAADDIQLGRGEPIKDTARVLGRMCQGAVIRTFAQSDVEEFAQFSGIPTINALTDEEHPCQILADLQAIREKLGSIEGKVVTFVGDGACNVPVSWIWAAARLGFQLRIAAPVAFQPSAELLARAGKNVTVTEDLKAAASGTDVLYTDVWVSMGKEDEAAYRLAQLGGYQISGETVALANPGVLIMHCLPAYRGKEITDEVFEANAQTIFDQAENRLHAQKAVLSLVGRP